MGNLSSKRVPIYVASGIFEEKDELLAKINGSIGDVITKESALRMEQEKRGGASAPSAVSKLKEREVAAAIDAAVLLQSRVLFGVSVSSFSTMLAQMRCGQNGSHTYYFDRKYEMDSCKTRYRHRRL